MRQTTWNQHIVKKKNKEIVLHSIIENAPLSRANIAQCSGLNKATVSSLVNELIEEELIYESGPGESSGGRRPVILHFNQNAGYSIGIDIGVNYTLGVITDLLGNVVNEINRNYEHLLTFQEQIEEIMKTIRQLISLASPSKYGIIGIGIAVPGIVDNNGKVLLAPNLKWIDIELKKIIEMEFDYPILVENEANAGVYGEKRFGVGKDVKNLVYVSVGIGIGVGFVLNGELYRGINGYSGESGHMTIVEGGKICNCGNSGCWEAYASENALLENANKFDCLAGATLEQLITLADNKNEEAIQLFKDIGSYVGIGINNLIKTFNPEVLIIGNRLAKAEPWIKESIENRGNQELLAFHQKDLKIFFSKHTFYATALGMAAFTIEEFLKTNLTDIL